MMTSILGKDSISSSSRDSNNDDNISSIQYIAGPEVDYKKTLHIHSKYTVDGTIMALMS